MPGSGLALKGAAIANKIRKARTLLKLKAGKLGIKIPKGALSKLGLGRKQAEEAEEAVVQGELSESFLPSLPRSCRLAETPLSVPLFRVACPLEADTLAAASASPPTEPLLAEAPLAPTEESLRR